MKGIFIVRNIFFFILSVYLIPLLIFFSFSLSLLPLQQGGFIVGIGIVLASLGTIGLYLIFKENSFSPTKIEIEKNISDGSELDAKLKNTEAEYLKIMEEKELFYEKCNKLQEDLEIYKKFSDEQLEYKDQLLNDSKKMIADLRLEIEKKQGHCTVLEGKIRDLGFEIKSLLQLVDLDTERDVKETKPLIKEGFISMQSEETPSLKKIIENSQNLTGTHSFWRNASQQNTNSDPYAVDLRHLFDSLEEEKKPFFVYSAKEQKPLYANRKVSSILDCENDRFVNEFSLLIEPSGMIWNKAVQEASVKGNVNFNMILKIKNHQEKMVKCEMGLIPSGLFRGLFLGTFEH